MNKNTAKQYIQEDAESMSRYNEYIQEQARLRTLRLVNFLDKFENTLPDEGNKK